MPIQPTKYAHPAYEKFRPTKSAHLTYKLSGNPTATTNYFHPTALNRANGQDMPIRPTAVVGQMLQ